MDLMSMPSCHFPQWTELSELLHHLDSFLHGVIDLPLRGEPPDAEPQRGVGHVVAQAEGPEDVGGLQAGAGAGAPTGDGELLGPMRRLSPSTYSKEMLTIPGYLLSLSPFIWTFSTLDSMPLIKRWLSLSQ